MWTLSTFPLYSAAVFRKSLHSTPRVSLDAQKKSMSSRNKEGFIFYLFKITESTTSWMKNEDSVNINSCYILDFRNISFGLYHKDGSHGRKKIKNQRNGRSVNFTEPLRLSGRLSRVTNFGIAAKNLHFVLCQHYTIADIKGHYYNSNITFKHNGFFEFYKTGAPHSLNSLYFSYSD